MRKPNLNKENYFTEAWKKTFPKSSALFCKWIDKYKKEVGWYNFFPSMEHKQLEIKFHDLPLEMQLGILARFFLEETSGYHTFTISTAQLETDQVKHTIDQHFHILELKLA